MDAVQFGLTFHKLKTSSDLIERIDKSKSEAEQHQAKLLQGLPQAETSAAAAPKGCQTA